MSSAELLGVVGFSCFLAWYFHAFFTPFSQVLDNPHQPMLVGLQTCGFVLIFVLSYILRRKSIRLVDLGCDARFLAIAGICGIPMPLQFIASEYFFLPLWISAVCMIPAAFCAMFFLISWEDACCRIRECSCLRYMCLSLGGGILLHLLITNFCSNIGSWVFAILLLGISTAALYAVQDSYDVGKAIIVDAPSRPGLDRRIALLGFTVNGALGLTWAIFISRSVSNLNIAFGICGVTALFASYLIYNLTRRHRNTVSTLMRISISGIAIGMIAPLALSGLPAVLCASIAIAIWFVYWATIDSMLIQHARNIGIAAALYLAPSKTASNGGFALGWCLGFVSLALGRIGVDPAWVIAAGGALAIIAIMCIIPFLRVEEDPVEMGVIHAPTPITHETKIAHLTQLHGLTPREAEVAGFLIKGRNAQAIAEKLVLSENTVRTHVYNIYKKTDVHSLQELIEYADNISRDPFEGS